MMRPVAEQARRQGVEAGVDDDHETSSLLGETSTANGGTAVGRRHMYPSEAAVERHSDHSAAGFWICGLLNNFAYVVFLTAAEELLTGHSGAILLANILPGLITKAAAPFFLATLSYSARINLLSTALSAAFLIVANSTGAAPKLLGIACGSAACGLGEVTFLSLCGCFPSRTVGSWSSGTGGAGFVGAGAWVILHDLAGIRTASALNLLSPAPLLVVVAYALLIKPSSPDLTRESPAEKHEVHAAHEPPPTTVGDDFEEQRDSGVPPTALRGSLSHKLQTLRPLLPRFMLPLFLVYYFEYLINQSMFFPAGLAVSAPGKAHISTACHTYSTLQFLYQLGVLVSRSSTSVFRISTLWPLPVLQGLNAGAMLLLIVTLGNAGGGSGGAETRWLVWLLVVWEGLLGGATYVNAFTNLSEFTSAREREFAMGITSLADSIGICLAALSSLHLEPALLRMMGISGAIHC